jgi:hypothetical protein
MAWTAKTACGLDSNPLASIVTHLPGTGLVSSSDEPMALLALPALAMVLIKKNVLLLRLYDIFHPTPVTRGHLSPRCPKVLPPQYDRTQLSGKAGAQAAETMAGVPGPPPTTPVAWAGYQPVCTSTAYLGHG